MEELAPLNSNFRLDVPVWTIINVDVLSARGLFGSLIVDRSSPYGEALRLFTTLDLAEEAFESAKASDRLISPITEVCQLRALLQKYRRIGINHVRLEFLNPDDHSIRQCHYAQIGVVLGRLKCPRACT